MSSSSGYLSESFSCKSDIDGTKRGKMENSEYAEFNDIGLKEMNPYDNKAEQMSTEESDRKVIRRRRCNYAISILSVAVLAGSCIVLCLFLVCKLPGISSSISCQLPPPPRSSAPEGCTVWRGTACHYQYYPILSHVREIRLLKETVIGKVTIFSVSDLTNDTNESMCDPFSKVNFSVYVQDAKIEVSVYISDTQCSHHGNYNIFSISDEKGFIESFWTVNVLAQCPCQLDLNITSTGAITCSFPNAEPTSVIIQKVSGDNQNLLVNESDIVHPIDLHTTNGFSATWSSDGTLKLTFMLGLLNCSHKGAYNISVTMNGTSTVHDVYLHVIDHPQIPVIAVESDGIIENQGGEISCRAMTGCSNAQFEFVLSGSGNDIWDIWRETNQPSSRLTYLGWETQFVTTISRDKVTNVDKRKFRCSYMTNRKIYISPALCIGIIPADFCQKDVGLCNYRHPYLCNKFVSCASATNPLERLCHQPNQPETHFVGSGGCHSSCDWPAKANCTLKNYCD